MLRHCQRSDLRERKTLLQLNSGKTLAFLILIVLLLCWRILFITYLEFPQHQLLCVFVSMLCKAQLQDFKVPCPANSWLQSRKVMYYKWRGGTKAAIKGVMDTAEGDCSLPQHTFWNHNFVIKITLDASQACISFLECIFEVQAVSELDTVWGEDEGGGSATLGL